MIVMMQAELKKRSVKMQANAKYRNYSWELRRRLDRLYRRVASVLLECDLTERLNSPVADKLVADKSFLIREGNEADDLQDIVSTFPDELGSPTPAMPEAVLRDEIQSRFVSGIQCFVVRDRSTNKLLGSVWLRDWYYPNILPVEKRRQKACAISRLYIVPEARGRGLARALIQHLLIFAKQKGYVYAFSLVTPKRVFSLRAMIRAGFTILGTCIHGSFMGRQFQTFRPGVRLAPGTFPIVPVVIVSRVRHDGSTLLSMVRALGRNGIPVYLLVKGPLTYTGKTRYIHSIEQFTGEISDQELIERLTAMIAKIGPQKQKPVMMHITENDIHRLGSIRPFLEEHFTVLPFGDVSPLLEKANQLPLAVEAGFHVPQSLVLRSGGELRAVSEKFRFPIIVKPLARHTVGKFPQKVLVYDSPKHFIEETKKFLEDKNTELFAQEYISGVDTNVLFCMASCDKEGKVRSCVSGYKLRQNPPGFGLMSSGVIDKNKQMEDKSEKLCQLFKIGGFIGIEAKMREGTDELYYIETNFRPEAINPLAEISGSDLVLDTYLTAIGEPCFISSPGPTGSYMNLQLEIEAIRHLVHSGKAKWTELLRPLPGPTAYSLFAPDDPLPFLRWMFDAVRLKMLRSLKLVR